jgi:hypothetical protein
MNYYEINYICIEDTFGNRDDDQTYHNFMKKLGYKRIYIDKQDRIYQRI